SFYVPLPRVWPPGYSLMLYSYYARCTKIIAQSSRLIMDRSGNHPQGGTAYDVQAWS
ncbi:uncharacterized protein METZ01_LOCUS413242, partial [marine metagenome]